MVNLFGIIGGHGAVATLQFHKLLTSLALNAGAYNDDDFPNLIITNIGGNIINTQGVITDAKNLKNLLIRTEATFTQAGTTHTLILCNTFHSEQKFMKKLFHGQQLLLPELVKKAIITAQHRKPFIVGSQTTLNYGLYESPEYTTINMFAGELIEAGMKNHTTHPLLRTIIKEAEDNSADSIILACTDLSVFHQELQKLTGLPVIDSLAVAANTIFTLHESGRK